MPSASQWVAFIGASILFIQVPGPSLLFSIGRALTVSRREALLSVVGNALGLVTQVLAVAAGLGAILAASTTAYTLVRVGGAAYLVWLGIRAIRTRSAARLALGSGAPPAALGASLRVGFVVGVTNPKTTLFFLAFLPQFTAPAAGHVGLQVLALGLVFGGLALASDSLWVLGVSRVRQWVARRPERLDHLSAGGGAVMVGLGAYLLARE